MAGYYNIEDIKDRIICGDTLEVLKRFPSESVDCVITSPPYWGVRDYGVEGQIGVEEKPELYIEKLLLIFDEVKRVLKKNGSFWLNIGDCYGSIKPTGTIFMPTTDRARSGVGKIKHKTNKCMMLIPERLVIRLVDEHKWILRQKVIWCKQVLIYKEQQTIGSIIPTPSKDRFNPSWEYLYHFVKTRKYYFDLSSVKVPLCDETVKRLSRLRTSKQNYSVDNKKYVNGFEGGRRLRKCPDIWWFKSTDGYKKNIPTVWQINNKSYNFKKELGIDCNHYAVFPQELCRIPVLSSCPPGGIVLDPFCGSGTSCLVAKRLGRHYVGIDINEKYCGIAKKRIEKECGGLL